MADFTSFHRPKAVVHTVNSGEASSGVAGIVFIDKTNTDDLAYTLKVRTSANVLKTDFTTYYEPVSGIVYVKNGSSSLVTNDVCEVFGMFYV